MKCAFCDKKATYLVHSLRRQVCDTHADQCAKMGVVVQEIKRVPLPVPQTDRTY